MMHNEETETPSLASGGSVDDVASSFPVALASGLCYLAEDGPTRKSPSRIQETRRLSPASSESPDKTERHDMRG